MKSIRLLSCLAVALAACSAGAQNSRPLPRRVNILLIVANGLSANDLSCYGQTQFQTPNLDKLAADGIRFTHYSAGSAASVSARASLMLGQDNISTDTDLTLMPGDVTIAQLLARSGYFTSLIGEWDLGGKNSTGAPWLQGFDEFAGFFDPITAENVYASSFWRYIPDPVHNDLQKYNGPETIYGNAGGHRVQYIPDWFTMLAMKFTKLHQPDKFNHYRPFFLVLSSSVPGNGNALVPTDAPYSEEAWPQAEKNRAAAIARLDNDIGELLQQLDKIGQASNTVVFFTSDTVPKKLAGIDPKFFQEDSAPDSLRVPMIVRWPGRIPAGQVSDRECSARDFLPTAADISLISPPGKIDGVSLLPTMLGQASK